MVDNGFNFNECEFISNQMKFYTFKEFCQNCYILKLSYEKKLSKNGKIFYKWFIYANIHMTNKQKNKIWDYLNNYIDKTELYKYNR